MTEVKTSKNWRSGLSVAECNRYMLKNEIHSDVTFLVGKEEKLVRAHKYVLASRSPVLDAMFYGDLAEAKKIKIPDIEPPSFDVLLRFLYCGDIALNQDTVIGVLYAADKYDVDELKKATQLYLEKNITSETVCTILENAKIFNLENLVENCKEFINENCTSVLQVPSAFELSNETLTEIMSSEYLNVDELTLYNFLIDWAEKQCERKHLKKSDVNIREQMGDAIFQIRFQFMKLDTFAKYVCRREILSEKEKLDVIQVIVGNVKKMDTKFNSKERKPLTFTIFRCSDPCGSWNYCLYKDCIEFTVNKSIKLHGLVMWGGKTVPYTYRIAGKLFENSNEVSDIPFQVIKRSDPSDTQFNISLTEPVHLSPNSRYKVWIQLDGPQSWGGNCYQKSVEKKGVQFIFYTHNGENNSTSETGGQFPGFVFSI